MENRVQISTKRQHQVLSVLVICVLGLLASSCHHAVYKSNNPTFENPVTALQNDTRFAPLSNKVTFGKPVTVVKDNTRFAPLLYSDPPLEELIEYILKWQNSLTGMAIMKIEGMGGRLSSGCWPQSDRRCQSYKLNFGTVVHPVVNAAGEILQPSVMTGVMLVKVGDEYGIMDLQAFQNNGGHVKYHLKLPRLGTPMKVDAGTNFANIEPQNWSEIEPYVWWTSGKKKTHGSLDSLNYQARPISANSRIRAVLDPVGDLTKPSAETLLAYNAETGKFGVMWLRDFQSAQTATQIATRAEAIPLTVLGDPIRVDTTDCHYFPMTSDLLPLVLIGMIENQLLVNRDFEVCPFKQGEFFRPVLTENKELLKSSGSPVLIKLNNDNFGLIYKEDYDRLVTKDRELKEAKRNEEKRQKLLAEEKARAATQEVVRKQEEDARKQVEETKRVLCSDLYLRTVDKKIAELTVREEQQIKECRWYGFYKFR